MERISSFIKDDQWRNMTYSTVTDTLLEGENKPFLFFELKVSYCFKPNTYEFQEELINWDYKGFRLGFE